MKTKVFVSLACLSLSSLSALAADVSSDSPPVQLPALAVTESRQNPAEQQIKRNLDALRALAAKPITVKVSMPLTEVKNRLVQTDPQVSTKNVVVAGL